MIVLNSNENGIQQITAAVQSYQNLNAIHIISHGDPGEIQLGNVRLNQGSVLENADAVSRWGMALNNGGDILLYGCDVAGTDTGRSFVNQLAQLTGADLNASTDLTGEKNLGGNWSLEYATGAIESAIAININAQAQFASILATYSVTNTSDSGAGSFRQAITDANANAGADTIAFSIGSGLATISPTSALPTITDAVLIDGTTQTGFSSAPIIEICGGSTGGADGLSLSSGASNSTIRGLIINSFNHVGISLQGADNVTIQGNYIGTNAAGTNALANGWSGIEFSSTSSNNTVGGRTVAERNIISGNTERGIYLNGSDNNQILGNYIGLNAAGTGVIANGWSGVELNNAADNNTIGGDVIASGGNRIFGSGQNGIAINGGSTGNTLGGTAAGAGNLISSNSRNGINVDASTGNAIEGNYIGTNVAGTAAAANGQNGISLTNGANGNIIGGTTAGAQNLISGNSRDGVVVDASSGNTIAGNYIGTNAAGTAAQANGWGGIELVGTASNNTIGGTTAAARNIISGNTERGVYLNGADSNQVLGNYIGLDVTGTTVIANGWSGVELNSSADNNIIGGAMLANGGNRIFGSGQNGIAINGASTGNTIGGTATGAGNIISSNGQSGINVDASTGNTMAGNYIGTNVAGTAAAANGENGISLTNGANGNTIGGNVAGAGNTISDNTRNGLSINASSGNTIAGNHIGTTAAGTGAQANGWNGIELTSTSANNTIGGTTVVARNIISGNTERGVYLNGADSNQVLGNYIGLDVTGTTVIANGWSGVEMNNVADNNVIGGAVAGARNVIFGNGQDGVYISAGSDNTIVGNYIGTNAAGTAAQANTWNGIELGSTSTNNRLVVPRQQSVMSLRVMANVVFI